MVDEDDSFSNWLLRQVTKYHYLSIASQVTDADQPMQGETVKKTDNKEFPAYQANVRNNGKCIYTSHAVTLTCVPPHPGKSPSLTSGRPITYEIIEVIFNTINISSVQNIFTP